MLSNSNTQFIKDLYSSLDCVYISEISANRAINSKPEKRGKIKELLITNYE